MMPELDGIQVCQAIKKMPQWQNVPIIIVTALSNKEDLARCLNAGADDFISKPINSIELRARIKSMLRIKTNYDALKLAIEKQGILEAEKVKLLEQYNADLEKKVAQRTAKLEEQTKIIQFNALHDPLTNLPNRNFLNQRLQQAIANIQKSVGSYAVLFLDLDRFKIINDSLGHLVGDQLLIIIAQQLQTYLGESDLVARFGGEEFVFLLDNINNKEDVIKLTEQIIRDFQKPFLFNGYKFFISTSIGIVFPNKNYWDSFALIRDADIAMYRAKAKGKNSYEVFDENMHSQALKRLSLENELHQALDRQEFCLYYQPIVDILSDPPRLVGFEALVRWQHQKGALIAPGEFISVAEEIGLITGIDSWVRRAACQQLAEWKTYLPHGFPLKISINLTAQSLSQSNLIEDIDRLLFDTGLEGDSITLEITESMLIENINDTIDLLTQLKARKIQISIDDFGTGYSSLNYLNRLPIDYLKIDRSFVINLEKNQRNYKIISSIIALSNQLGLTVIAEGIETPQQLKLLQNLGSRFGQGYLFSKPLAVNDIVDKNGKLNLSKIQNQIVQWQIIPNNDTILPSD